MSIGNNSDEDNENHQEAMTENGVSEMINYPNENDNNEHHENLQEATNENGVSETNNDHVNITNEVRGGVNRSLITCQHNSHQCIQAI